MLDQLPSPVRKREARNCDVAIGIDFGTTLSGYAFSFREDKSNISVPTHWGTCVGVPNAFKAPSCVVTDAQGNFKAFGYEAQQLWSCFSPNEAKKHEYFENFKLQINKKVDCTRRWT
jgi:hypothetical protein